MPAQNRPTTATESSGAQVWFVDAESFKGPEHLATVLEAAKGQVNTVIG